MPPARDPPPGRHRGRSEARDAPAAPDAGRRSRRRGLSWPTLDRSHGDWTTGACSRVPPGRLRPDCGDPAVLALEPAEPRLGRRRTLRRGRDRLTVPGGGGEPVAGGFVPLAEAHHEVDEPVAQHRAALLHVHAVPVEGAVIEEVAAVEGPGALEEWQLLRAGRAAAPI